MPGIVITLTQFSSPLADVFYLVGNGFNPVIKPEPVTIKTEQDLAHSGRDLILALLENGFEGILQSPQPFADRDALFNQESADLVYRCSPAGHQARPASMECLQVELVLAFLGDCRQVRSQGCLRNGLSIIVVILLPP